MGPELCLFIVIKGSEDPSSNVLERNRTWRLLFTEFWLHAVRDPELQHKLAERYQVMRDDLARLLEQYFTEQGRTLSLPAQQLAAMLVALMQGLGMQKMIDPPVLASDLFLTAFDLLLKGTDGDQCSGE